MSAATPQTPPPAGHASPDRQEITIVSHSTLLYWWPVWALGFILAGLTAVEGYVMAVVPHGSKEYRDATVIPAGGQPMEGRDVVVLDQGKRFPSDVKSGDDLHRLRVSRNKTYGVSFLIVLLLVIFITNVPLRGMWSLVIIMTVVLVSIIFALADLWEPIIRNFALLDIRINVGGYLMFSGILFLLWLLVFIFFDRQVYITFTPGQFRVCTEIGGGERAFDTMGMSLEKHRSDLFRHWILGLGSGDLTVKTTGAKNEHFDLYNVLFINKKVHMIDEMLRKRNVIETHS
jgi:hypothetical protein